MLVKYQTPKGLYFSWALQNENLILDMKSEGIAGDRAFQIIGAYIIIHFGEKKNVKPPLDILKTSLTTLIDSFQAEECRGYHQGRDAYRAWIRGLSEESDFRIEDERENVLRRLDVNDNMLCNLADARRAAAAWLREDAALTNETGRLYLAKIAENCRLAELILGLPEMMM